MANTLKLPRNGAVGSSSGLGVACAIHPADVHDQKDVTNDHGALPNRLPRPFAGLRRKAPTLIENSVRSCNPQSVQVERSIGKGKSDVYQQFGT